MSDIYSDFLSEENLEQCCHSFTTQANESFNNVITSYAPKNRVYGSSISLSNRISITIGVKNVGKHQYWKRVYKKMGMTLPLRLSVFLQNSDNRSAQKKQKEETPSYKKKRAFQKNEQIKAEAEQTKRSIDNNYGTGIGLATINTSTTTATPSQTERKSTQTICPLPGCGIIGHKTNRSKKCRWYGHFPGTAMMHLPQLIKELLSQQKQNNESRVLKNLVEKLDAP